MKQFQEEALLLVAEALGKSGTVGWEDPETVRITIDRGPSFTLRMAPRREDDPSTSGPTPTLWILRRPKRGELQDLRAKGKSFVALNGAVRIQVPGVLIDRTDLRLPAKSTRPSQRSAFSDRASLIARWLFYQPTNSQWTITGLAEAAGVSPSVASYAVQDLEQRHLVETKASGSGTFVLNVNGSNTLDYRIEVDNIEGLLSLPADTQPTSSAHIHRAGAGANGEIEIFLSPAVPTGPPFVWEGTAFLSDELLDALLAGELYVNVHTAENAAGEVRGQIVADARNCQDPTRTAFVGSPEKPEIGGTNTEGCPSFLDPQSCATGWQISPNSGQSVQCVWRAQSLRCGACGPTLENSGQCSNSCR